MNPNSSEKYDFRRLVVALSMLAVFIGSAKLNTLHPDYSAAIVFWCVLIQVLLVLSYYGRQD